MSKRLAGLGASVLVLAGAAAQAAPPRRVEGAGPRPSLRPDAAGYCQRTEFLAWSADGTQAAYSESYCAEPPPDAPYDALNLVARDGTILQRTVGAQAGAALGRETRGRLLFAQPVRKEGAKGPDGRVARVTTSGDSLRLELPGLAPFAAPLALPYPTWPLAEPPKVAGVYWAPDGRALAVEVRAARREPRGGKLGVSAVYFAEAPAPAAAPTPAKAPAAPRKDQ
jgi:hypothetical protein